MPRPPRMPRPPAPPSLPRLPGPLQLSPIRSTGSPELDRELLKDGRGMPPYLRWDAFLDRVRFRQGEHITIVGTTGSGKTVLGRELVEYRDYTAVLGTKNEDRELYAPFQARGYLLTDDFDPSPPPEESRIIFRPRMSTPDQKGLDKQSNRFEAMLFEVWEYGGWALFADEIWTLTKRLKLASTFETFWSAGRSNNITVVALTQLPVDIPLMAFDQATHLFLFRNTDKYRINRMAEFAGADSEILKHLIPRLPRFEFVYVDTRTGLMLRSKAIV